MKGRECICKPVTDPPAVTHLILLKSHEEGIISILLEMKVEQAAFFGITCSGMLHILKFNKYLLLQTGYLYLQYCFNIYLFSFLF